MRALLRLGCPKGRLPKYINSYYVVYRVLYIKNERVYYDCIDKNGLWAGGYSDPLSVFDFQLSHGLMVECPKNEVPKFPEEIPNDG